MSGTATFEAEVARRVRVAGGGEKDTHTHTYTHTHTRKTKILHLISSWTSSHFNQFLFAFFLVLVEGTLRATLIARVERRVCKLSSMIALETEWNEPCVTMAGEMVKVLNFMIKPVTEPLFATSVVLVERKKVFSTTSWLGSWKRRVLKSR